MPKRKTPAAKASPKNSTATSRPSLAIEIDPDLLAQLRQLPKTERRKVGDAIESVRADWGRPHLHSGAGIRRLGANLHECRVGLQSRLLFQTIGTSLYFHFMGSHDEVQKFLRAHA
jgi:mRNA-degrading endonuclease RelE of RelBE toxin-antitoxin system